MDERMVRVYLEAAAVCLQGEVVAAGEGMDASEMVVGKHVIGLQFDDVGKTEGGIGILAHLLVRISQIVEDGFGILSGFLCGGQGQYRLVVLSEPPVDDAEVGEEIDIFRIEFGQFFVDGEGVFVPVGAEIYGAEQGKHGFIVALLPEQVEQQLFGISKIAGDQRRIRAFQYDLCLISHAVTPESFLDYRAACGRAYTSPDRVPGYLTPDASYTAILKKYSLPFASPFTVKEILLPASMGEPAPRYSPGRSP